jgi:hypothetical protein
MIRNGSFLAADRCGAMAIVLSFVAVACVLAGCGSGASGSNNNAVATITVTSPSPSIAVGATQQFTATATNKSGNAVSGVTFTWASSAMAVATINSSGLASGVSAGKSQITASASGVTSSPETLTITPPPIVVSPPSGTLPNGTVRTAYSASVTATGGIAPYTFALDSASTALPSGLSFSSNGTGGVISGTPITAGTTSNIVVDVTDSEQPPVTQKATYSLMINPSSLACVTGGSESLLSGAYAFLLKGFDSSGNPALVIGTLTFDATGTITGGALDTNLNSGVQSDLLVSSGNYGVGSDQRGCMVITTSAGTQNYRFSLGGISGGVASTGHVIDFDTSGPFTTGIMSKQSGAPFSNSSINGTYAFGGSSMQNAAVCASPCKFGTVGVVTFDGSGDVTGGSQDVNQNGTLDGSAANTTWPTSPIPIDNGTYSVSSNGRATLTLSFGSGASSSNNVLYLVSSTEAFFMTTDSQTTSNISAGAALEQSGTPFAANPLSGTYVGYDSGTGITGVGRTDIILLGPLTSGDSAISATDLRNNGGTFSSSDLSDFTYSVSAIGRMIISGGSGFPHVLYLANTNQAFFLNGNASVDAGFFASQSGGPFSNSSVTGTYALGIIEPVDSITLSGVAVFSSPDNIGVTSDGNGSGGPTGGQVQTLTYSIGSTGLGLIPSGCSITVTPITCDTAFYILSSTQVIAMDLQSANPKIQTADQ